MNEALFPEDENFKPYYALLCPEYRLPETTRKTDHLVNSVLKSEGGQDA